MSFLAGSAINCYLLVEKILGYDIWGRPILIVGVTLVLAGIQFLTFGLIAELIMRVYYESQHKKTYNVREVCDFKDRINKQWLNPKKEPEIVPRYYGPRKADLPKAG